MTPLAVTAYTATSAMGGGLAAQLDALAHARSGLRPNDFSSAPLACWIGRVDGVEDVVLPAALAAWDCRNNRLAWLGLQQDGLLDRVRAARARYGATRVALLLGTSTASIGATEEAYRRLDADGGMPDDMLRPAIHAPHSLVGFVAAALALEGPCLTVSTACSSSAKVFASAERMLRLGLVDAALVGGVDTLCDSVLFGFNALELVSPEPCRPFDSARNGISIGEAAGFALLERIEAAPDAPQLLGYGESSDAYHMSTPHPDGLGAELALNDALARAGLDAALVDYINLHGTASQKNDEVEAALVARTFPTSTRASSTKGFTGHTLGAAGILEATVALQAIEHGLIPGNLGGDAPDPGCGAHFAWRNERRRVDVALSNSFGFGGNNACLAFARAGFAA
ncbi:beta-ketoacyl-[acyl-carrier-protein] synthase II [Rhodanobacter thiooxydans]|uniref:Beta-ketoacyl-[acyl-carrier-protein] synthase II n=2 Tax=Rhodanobacter thiooxydans TaxID=416169 RepID=A0A154QFI2_9GAMM|nr:beta-ketoacyl-[acyl-carrier-protein] synthase family protein [Rhodanobacter thiooxydans]KZC23039.1 beta-ketoacyl-[acyl-carrier-protein] synthase II [Rhodanobacter thiooxydans]MCW0203009.1 beta-ketoacyl-[acyl-carrier-protein] synthase family protein [Rhodanobacter thiooxydans]